MNRMTMEQIKHEAARRVFDGTEYEWTNMLDQTEEQDRKAIRMTEEESRSFWMDYFEELLVAVRWSDQEAADAD